MDKDKNKDKEIQIFKNEKLNLQIRVIKNEDGSISINAEDTAIGFGWTREKNEKKYVMWNRFNGFMSDLGFPHLCGKDDFIPESLFYRLGMKASNKVAEEFQNWLAIDVIPSIRKHGAYMTENALEEALTNPDFLIKLATELKEEQSKRKALEEEKKLNAPKVIFADAVSTSKTNILVGELAKILKQNGVDTGQNRLFEWLRENGYLIKRKGTDYNMPTQRSIDLGLFDIKESVHLDSNGVNVITKTPKVTGKGQQYFISKFLNKEV
ncbi:MAG: phage antirepressor [Clostridium sp.]